MSSEIIRVVFDLAWPGRNWDKNEFIIWSEPHAEDFYLKKGCAKIGTRPSVVVPNRYPSVLKYKITKEATPLKSKI